MDNNNIGLNNNDKNYEKNGDNEVHEPNVLPFIHEKLYSSYGDTKSSYEQQLLKINGACPGDKIIVYPVQGKRREVILTRTIVLFSSTIESKMEKSNVCEVKVYLPTINRCPLNFELRLEQNDRDENICYRLRSLNNIPYRLNGNFCFDSYIELNDRVVMGYNTVIFSNKREEKSDKSEKSDKCSSNIYLNLYDEDSNLEQILNNKNLLESELNILLEGETGSGKTYIAKKIHEKSGRKGAFIHININSFASGLIESELFGHVKGAYTGAICDKKGAFLEANNGTLFIDEIDSLPIEIQTKLLLFLDFKKIRAVGSLRETKSDVRLIFASGKNLKSLVKDFKMRSDFYYRILTGIQIEITPLRNNKKKLEAIIEWLSCSEDVVISRELKEFYQKLYWPGNI
ncbi:MAG: sigma-54 factor interaction domain-containing protein, partial [Oligoflexia bacterium]|nr:sigma-54 factor interaction domain-containing protein [Oligoflexia bacterium]